MTRALLVLGLALTLLSGAARADKEPGEKGKPKAEDSYFKVEAKGKITTGVMAIGGETTGNLISTPQGPIEVQLDKKLQAEADKLKGKVVVVTGMLTIKKGVERGPRVIIVAATLKAADAK